MAVTGEGKCMDEAELKTLADRTAGAVTALEDQVRVPLAAIVNAGVEPGLITGWLDQIGDPGLQPEAAAAYRRVMAPFAEAARVLAAERQAKAEAEAGPRVAG